MENVKKNMGKYMVESQSMKKCFKNDWVNLELVVFKFCKFVAVFSKNELFLYQEIENEIYDHMMSLCMLITPCK